LINTVKVDISGTSLKIMSLLKIIGNMSLLT